MSNQSKKPKKTKGLGAGIIAFGAGFALYSVLFHPHGLGGFLLGLILAGLVGAIVRVMGSGLDLSTHNKQDATPESLQKVAQDTGDPEVDAILQRGRDMIVQIRDENKKIPDTSLTDKLNKLESLCSEIFRAVYDKPAKASQIRKFMDYYLPTTLKMVKGYRTLGERNLQGQDVAAARQRIDDALGIVLKGCQKMLDNLYKDDVLDITTDIDVLEQMLKRDGLTESQLHMAAEQAKAAAVVNATVNAAARQTAAQQTAQPSAPTYDPSQWHTGMQTDVAQKVQTVVQQSQTHVAQVPTLGGQAMAQAPQQTKE